MRKTWITDDLTRKSHTQIKPTVVVKTAIPDLGLVPAPAASAKPEGAAGSAATAAPEPAKSGCGCRAVGSGDASERSVGATLALALAGVFGAARARLRYSRRT